MTDPELLRMRDPERSVENRFKRAREQREAEERIEFLERRIARLEEAVEHLASFGEEGRAEAYDIIRSIERLAP